MVTTNVRASELNYDRYSMSRYDRDIVNSIPFHEEIHRRIRSYLAKHYRHKPIVTLLDLGVGTGLTSQTIRQVLPQSKLEVVDFSRHMLDCARQKLGNAGINYIFGDYSKIRFRKKYDIITSVIGLHHQTHAGKQRLFKKIYKILKPGGIFIYADLVTYKQQPVAAYNHALHFHHLVENSGGKKSLAEWAYHHWFLNDPAPIEDQIEWLRSAGFKVEQELLKYNTALLICGKPPVAG